jgi:hypothetical protein
MHKSAWNGAAMRFLPVATAALLLTGCGTTMVSGDAGCGSYGEARLAMPDALTVPDGAWGEWIADLDDRMTGACR